MDDMKYLIELTVLDYYFSTQRTSTVALAAVYNAVGDMRSNGHREQLRAFLGVIMECFDLDHSEQVSEVRRKLQSLLLQDDGADERSLDEGGVDLDDSVRTCRVSNRSIQERYVEGSYISHERDETGHEGEDESTVSPNASLHDLSARSKTTCSAVFAIFDQDG